MFHNTQVRLNVFIGAPIGRDQSRSPELPLVQFSICQEVEGSINDSGDEVVRNALYSSVAVG